ncbi:MAG: adenosylcobinamide-GDP ribazoletransferase [Frankiales bacterium]|nr:adenosylcobinamide-GDP ribazoletransferase [Frankiales bacterium]
MPEALRLALTTLTVARVRSAQVTRHTAGRAMELAPLVGLMLGLAGSAVLITGRVLQDEHLPSLLPPVLAVGALALLTRGLHLDGLADLADGLGSYKDPEGARRVMKAPDVGPFGVVTLVLVLLIQVAALQSCVLAGRGTASLLLAVATGRLAITAACARTPAAADQGLGAMVARTVRRGVPSIWIALLAGGFGAYAIVDPDTSGTDSLRVMRTVLAVLLALAVCRLLRDHAVRRLGGLTGDVLGALSEVATTVALVVLSVGGHHT